MHGKFKWLFPYDAAPGLGCKNKILYLDALVASFYDNPSLYEVKLDERLEVKYDPEVTRPKTVYEKCRVELQHRKAARKAAAQEMGAEEYEVDALEEQLLENTERLIKEVTVDEIAHIADVLNGLDPKDLAFNRLFGDKFRLVIDFPTLDTSTELGQFIDLWRIIGYTVDWDKGTVSGDRVMRDVSPAGFADQIFGMTAVGKGTQFKKINMKIGKWLTKLLGYQTKYQALRQKVEDYYSKEGPGAARGLWKQGPRPPGGYTGNQIEKALSEQELKNYYRLESYIYMMARSDIAPFPPQLESVQSIQKLINYWRDNAAFIKKEVSKAKDGSSQYSIIITRHPLDVLRMSDFENIQSCHSPPSRGGGSAEYKCAVAEAHGHGAVAYVVKTKNLLETTKTDDIESAERAIQDGEIFFDDERPHVDTGMILPVARTRLRQVKYYEHTKDPETYAGRNPYEGVELAVPEIRTYPDVSMGGVPGFAKRILDWAKENQKEQIEGAPIYMTTRGGTKQIDLDQFIKFGGSYQDNLINSLIKNLWPQDENFGFNGTIVQDTDTENKLDASLMSVALVDQYQEAVNDLTETYNNRMRYCEVEGSAFDDGDGGVAIEIDATMMLKWHKSEWKSLPNRNQAEHVDSELNELGYSWADLSDIGAQNHNIVVTFKILPQKLVGFSGFEYAWAPENFEEFAQLVDTECDDKAAGVKQVCEVFFKREGWMEGGAIVELGHEVLNGEYSSSEWDAEAEEGYEYGEMESVRFTTDVTVSYADINDAIAGAEVNYKGINEETSPAIAESRQFRIALRKAMTTPAQEAVNKSYYPPIETETLSVSPTEIFIRIGYYASMDDPDGLVEVLKALVEHWDDWHNEVHDVVKKTFIWAARQAKVADQAAPGELGLEEQRLFEVEDMLRRPIVLKERGPGEGGMGYIPDWAYDIIYGYVIQGKQPARHELTDLKDILNSKEYHRWLRWYRGTAYRGMIVSDAWVDEWLGGKYSDWEKRKGKLLSKHIFNLFKRFKGKIERDIKIAYGPGMRGVSGKQLAREDKPMESWSRSYSVAKSYAVPSGEDFYHQQSGFGKGLRGYIKGGGSSVLSIILESDGSAAPSGMAGSDEGAFLDLEPLYKLPGLAPESHIQEVPSIVPFITITRIHIPYEDFLKSYERATKKWQPWERERVTPYIKEAAEKAGIILF